MADLKEYRKKRRFDETSEPRGKVEQKDSRRFVIQKHAARRLHYDLRLEMHGTLKSWAVPKGPSLNPGDKRLAIHVEDHPLDYRTFEGSIPKGNYGAGEVIVWDEGTYSPEGTGSSAEQLERGDLKFRLHGEKLRGSFALVRIKRGERQNEWLLIKHRDEFADPNWNIEEHSESVVTGRTLADVKESKSEATWQPTGKRLAGAGEITRAREAAMPERVAVTLATLGGKPFSDAKWLFEIKWDGVRALAFVEDGKTRLVARSGRDVTEEYPEFKNLAGSLAAKSAILDGEIVTLDAQGRSNFHKLQNRISVVNPSDKLRADVPVTYYAFDLLYWDGFDLRQAPLLERKERLRAILRTNERVRFSEHQLEKGKELAEAAEKQKLEGIVAKQIESAYTGNRTPLWIKLKNVSELDAVVVGWTAPRRSRQYFGALVLGLYEGKELKFIGNVGTGFDTKKQKEVLEKLQSLKVARSAFRTVPKIQEAVEWVKPELVARVKYANWTTDRHLRAPVFLSLRADRTAAECTFEEEQPAKRPVVAAIAAAATERSAIAVVDRETASRKTDAVGDSRPADGATEIADGKAESLRLQVDGQTLSLTHLNKVYFPESGIRKRDLLTYYYRMADYILPFLQGRPLVLRRYPNGIQDSGFFQKAATPSVPDWIERATVFSEERGGNMEYVMAKDRASLLYLTNLGCIDHNPWSSTAEDQEHPDYVFFDLDPTPTTPFTTVLRVARTVRKVLDSVRMKSFLKTSGATGFHIFVPLERRYVYEQTRTFAQIIGQLVAAQHPQETTGERAVRKRPNGRVMIDALQNARGKPLASAYSVRAEAGAPVSTPITAAELQTDIEPGKWNVKTMPERLRKVGDLWKEFWKSRQTLDEALELLGKQMGGGKRRG
ncbi:MAG TPA: DNA ligase D [Candidatus Acidoferrum sp.]|jgi:bifunctional non-homologous end joining protein LigD